MALLTCYGEVQAQAGNPSGALSTYATASKLEPGHPLPFLNAAHVYQQLNQQSLAKKHSQYALTLDDTLSLTLVDIAQAKMNESRFYLLHHSTDKPLHQDKSSADTALEFQPSQRSLLYEKSSLDILESALGLARHASEIIDIFASKQICQFYTDLTQSGLVPSSQSK